MDFSLHLYYLCIFFSEVNLENIQIREVGVLETEFIEAKIGDLLQADLPAREKCKSTSINEI